MNMSGMEGSACFMHIKCALVASVKMVQISSVIARTITRGMYSSVLCIHWPTTLKPLDLRH